MEGQIVGNSHVGVTPTASISTTESWLGSICKKKRKKKRRRFEIKRNGRVENLLLSCPLPVNGQRPTKYQSKTARKKGVNQVGLKKWTAAAV